MSHPDLDCNPTANRHFQEVIDEALANPAAYGIDNVTGPACGTTSSLVCTRANVTGTLSYLFADDRHPTPTTHALLGNYFASLLQAPYFAEALANVPAAASSGWPRITPARPTPSTICNPKKGRQPVNTPAASPRA
jgi:phospholipase/lecithinase/hemolysin